MLPNWLLGKSKSKLQEILGGGGTPSDYAEVKAQVAQNAEDIAFLDTNNQALMAQSDSMINVLGAKNLLPQTGEASSYHGVDFTVNSDGTVGFSGIITDDSTTFNYAVNEAVPNTWKGNTITFGVFRDTIADAYAGLYVYDSSNTLVAEIATNGNTLKEKSEAIPSNADHYIVQIVLNNNRAVSGTLYPMLRLASITDDTYVPYTMTNQELTDKLTADANLGTAVDLSTYNTYSNLYTAPSDGYVHFLSAASGSAARTIYTYGNNTTAATDPHFTHSTSANNKAFEIFIKKGLKVYVDGLQSGDAINFYPLS